MHLSAWCFILPLDNELHEGKEQVSIVYFCISHRAWPWQLLHKYEVCWLDIGLFVQLGEQTLNVCM